MPEKDKTREEIAFVNKPKKIHEILEEQIDASLHEFNRSNLGLFLSAFTAGLEIGFSILLIGTVYTLFGGEVSPENLKLFLSLCYPLGFVFVIIGRSELFTEHTALAILPVLNRSVTVKDLLQLWGIVYLGNLLGGFLFGVILVALGTRIGFIDIDTYYFLAHDLIKFDGLTIFLSALLAGWLMGLLGWLLTSSQETMSRILLIILITSIIGIAGLHHCIIGSIEVFSAAISSSKVGWSDYFNFQVWATLGNAIGGTVFVAILKYSHVRFR